MNDHYSPDSSAASSDFQNSLDSHLERSLPMALSSPISMTKKDPYATPSTNMRRSIKVNTACALSSFAAAPAKDLVLLGGRDILKVRILY